MEKKQEIKNNGSFLWVIIGCCVPQISLALYFILKDKKPRKAKFLATGACITLCILIVLIIYMIFDNYKFM